ncbi:helix-turn-helix domain-containing protein [Spirillospora sp. CA-128828]|uniref:helix-turn-helix domain-containing protein n=1 Tax=Spirillospora sp. CA-128828 TaxID=3240033 RepID=UPI003D917406
MAGRKRGTVLHDVLRVLSVRVLSVAAGSFPGMSRYRLQPTPAQEQALLEHCGHARFVWNLAVEQHAGWRPGRRSAPGFAAQCRQLTQPGQSSPGCGRGRRRCSSRRSRTSTRP